MYKLCLCFAVFASLIINVVAVEQIKLPAPVKSGGKPLMTVLNQRASNRSFSKKELSLQQVSNLLWAAFGINRPDGKRTAPTAMNSQEFDIYVAMKNGLYVYDPKANVLKKVLDKDIRAACGTQKFHASAPVDLIYVVDFKRARYSGKEQKFYAGVDCGYISQNVYLYCASENLSTVACGLVDRKKLAAEMKLGQDQAIVLTQPVGYPAK